MNRKKRRGMWIRQTEVCEGMETAWIVSMVTALAAGEILILSWLELTGSTYIYTPWVTVIAAGFMTAAYGISLKLHKQKLFYPVVLVVLLLMVIVLGRSILSGGCAFWNQAGDAWTAVSGRATPQLEASGEALELLMFSVFLGFVIALLYCALNALSPYIPAILTPLAVFWGMALFQNDGTFKYIIPCLLLAVCLLVCGDGQERALSGVIWRISPVVICSILMLFATAWTDVDRWADEAGETAQDKIHAWRYETEYTTLPEGNFADYKEVDTKGQPALVVTMEQPEELYLRGFTGAAFSEGSWHAPDNKTAAENEDLLYWMNQNGWNPQMQFGSVYGLMKTEGHKELQNITVQNLNACSEYLYAPYSLCSDRSVEAEDISQSAINANGSRMYSYSVAANGTDKIDQLMKLLKESDDEEIEAYRQAESAYRQFVYEHYLDIPEDIGSQLAPYWGKISSQSEGKDKIISLQGQEHVTIPMGGVQDSSYQTATVDVLTLRYFGIPARYAEGYVITEEMAESMEENSSIQLDSTCAAAWAEVYHDGIGWIPVNMTPGAEEEKKSADNGDQEGDEPEKITPKGDLQQQPDDRNKDSETGGGYVVSIQKAVSLTFLLVLVSVLLMAGVLALRRYMLMKHRRMRWEDENVNDAVAWIFADTERLLRRLGFDRGRGSMAELLSPIQERFGADFAATFKEMTDINARAIFSSRRLDETHRETAKIFYEDTLKHLRADVKWHNKLWMKWALCLY